jgi:hypothetical protein
MIEFAGVQIGCFVAYTLGLACCAGCKKHRGQKRHTKAICPHSLLLLEKIIFWGICGGKLGRKQEKALSLLLFF